jgi:hypothetical protein
LSDGAPDGIQGNLVGLRFDERVHEIPAPTTPNSALFLRDSRYFTTRRKIFLTGPGDYMNAFTKSPLRDLDFASIFRKI